MNNAKIIGLSVTVLAVIGGVAVYNYVRKPKQNNDGFFGANGFTSRVGRTLCTRINPDGSTTQYTSQGGSRPCPYGGIVSA